MYSSVPNYFDFNFSATKKSNVSFWRYFCIYDNKKTQNRNLNFLKKEGKEKEF